MLRSQLYFLSILYISFSFLLCFFFFFLSFFFFFFFFQAEDGIRDVAVTGVQKCALPISTSSIDVTVTSDSGKRVEKVLIAKSGDRYIAKRENEPALYELNASAITDMQKAAADVKPRSEERRVGKGCRNRSTRRE